MEPTSSNFKNNARRALNDIDLQRALARAKSGFIDKRRNAIAGLPEFYGLCDQAKAIKDHTLAHLDFYLEKFESNVHKSGGRVHWANSPEQARELVIDLCQKANAKTVTKGKTMVGEEIAINQALIDAGIEPIETDLGEYIVQLAKESPSHIIAPAVHKTREQISELFYQHHQEHGCDKKLWEIPDLVNEARKILRDKFLNADVGITGANFLIAETGSIVLVTNEGNGDLTATLPRIHIVIAGIEKIVPSLDDAGVLLRVLARSATGQEMTAYTSIFTGPKGIADLDGPEEFHVVLLDNCRTEMLGNEFREMLRCIRCGACLNHCPVYGAIGGHAYGWVYPGPMGAILTPTMIGHEQTTDLPNACTLNGRCQTVCPVRIDLPRMLRLLRVVQFEQGLTTKRARLGLGIWAYLAKHHRLYHGLSDIAISLLRRLGRRKGRFRGFLFAGAWTRCRDLAAPQSEAFQRAWKKKKERGQHTPTDI